MSRQAKRWLFPVILVGLAGCGGGNAEIKPATEAPKMDPAEQQRRREQSMKESMEKGKLTQPQGATPGGTTP